ncbi:protein-glutamine gamma-glutamyltransferase E-like [Hyperolius riggenbachi]|uniref:protein-glutamine gamma-glutamyltransferase E-like n=1 Tax=Hyperolius riggenbachi TaxID=752182 RepID=UPI0035A3A38B
MTVTITSPADVAIGRYRMGIQVNSGGYDVYQSFGGFILLFNPWCEDDAVYMNDEAGRKEYVLNESGILFYGNGSPSPAFRPWDFGQFEENILSITLKLLDSSIEYRRSSTNDLRKRGDPAYVGRILSAMVNSPGDNGVIVGNWSGNYAGGVTPTRWNGSVEILRKWNESGPVEFGQCWVYGGVLCTVLRCLGIPARAITNFSSAHDTEQNLTIDRYFNEYGRELYNPDSIWNFHVWDEGWFARKDLGSSDYDGWQVLDATPQEQSEGTYRLGPCSVNAVKEGDVDLSYDTPFVFSEVNGDRVDWIVENGVRRMIYRDTRSVGQFMSTKAIGAMRRLDITNNYKYPEGSAKEREVFMKALNKLRPPETSSTSGSGTVAFSAQSPEATPKPEFEGEFTQNSDSEVGQDLTFNLKLKNTGDRSLCLHVKMTATAIVYTNAPIKEVLQKDQPVGLGPKEEEIVSLIVPYAQYGNAITADNMIKAVAVCEDEKGGKLLVETVMRLKSPPILIKAAPQGQVDEPLSIEILFTNPLSEVAENCVLTVEGSGIIKEQIKIEVPILQAKEQSVTKLDTIPYRSGQRIILVDFFSDKFSDVKGLLQVDISKA